MADRDHLSIGEVLTLLRDDFPDVTVSKIRFLESRGLIAPERTPSGYRKFYDTDIERLRWILTQQKVHFLPLRVIRERLDQEELDFGPGWDDDDLDEDDDLDDDDTPSRPDLRAVGPVGAHRPRLFEYPDRTLALSADELVAKSDLTLTDLRELERLGLIVASTWGDETVYDDEALVVAALAGRFKAQGVDARHLRMYKVAAEREAGLYEQLLLPLLKRTGEAHDEAADRLEHLAGLGEELRGAMLRQSLRTHLQ